MYAAELERLCNFLKQCQADYDYYYEQVGIKDKEKCDLEHELLHAEGYKNRLKVNPKLYKVLQERREAKDIVEKTYPIANYIRENRKVFDGLSQVLGQVRKIESSHVGRAYKPRVRKDLTIAK